MENIGGALAFKATLDIDDFKVSSEAMARHIKNASNTAVAEANRMEQSFLTFAQNGARYIVSYLVGQGMMSLVQSIVQVRGQFQQLELAFNTMLRSTEKSQVLMSQLVDTAARTPLDLTSIAQGAKQMLAFGSNVESVVDEIVMLGNVASGVSAPLGDLIYLYGTLRSQGRAYTVDIRQFAGRGIPIYEELGKVLNADRQELNKLVTEGKVGFPEVEKAFKNMTSEGGIYFNLMQEQSKSLTGMLSNLGDAWDSALNKIGQDNEGLFTGAIQGAIGLVENMDEILRIVEAVTIAYGSYKAAIALNTLILKGYTGVSFLDNTYKQAKIALLNTEAKITGQVAVQTKAMTVAQEARVAALEKELTAEEQANLVKKLRIATIQQLLTAQQQEYLSNLNLTTSSANYEAVATSVLTVEQREALSKTDLSAKSAVYRAALEQEVAAKRNNIATSVEALRGEVKLAASRAESAKKNSISAMQATEAARASLLAARQSGNASKIATAEKRLETAQTKQLTLAQERMAAVADFNAKKKQLEAAAIQQSRLASSLDTAAKTAQATTTNLLTLATNKLTTSLKALWVSMKANPITWVVSLVGMAYSAISMLSSKTKELEEDTVSLTNATKRATERFSEEAGKVEALEKIIRNSNVAYDERNKALNELKQIIPGYNAELTKEGNIINDNSDAIQRYLGLLEKQIRMKAAQEELEAAYREKRLKEKEISQKQAAYDEASANVPDVAYGDAGAQYQMYALNQAGKAEKRLKQAQKELTDINKTIEALNKEISDTSGEIDKSSESAKTYSEQIADTRAQITNLTKELEDLRSGKVVKDNLAAEIDAKIKELNTAKKNLELLTGITTSGNRSNGTSQLSQKELEAQHELEEARISIMEDGYEKRKALLDLQHKENLDRIDREERELEKARKAAGKGGLTATEQEGFDERRSIENTSYQREQNKLFDGEIAYKKQQYELYFRWVRNLGEDVANTQFANLLKGGASFKQYLENQIAEMNQKKQAGTLTEGEGNHLISLNMQYDEITGAKSAMDLFKESVTEAISQATTLAEKVQAIADAKERLANGSTGLVGADEQAEASLFVSEKQAEADKEIQEKILTNYRSYEEQKKAIQDEYAMLRSQAIAQNNEEILAKLNEGENEALSALNASFLMQSESWRNLFTDLDALTVEQIDKLVRDIQSKMNTSDMNLNPADMKAVLDRLDEAKQKILDVNPFKSLGNAIKAVFGTAEQKSKHSSGNIKTDWKNLASATEGCFNFVNDAIDSCDVLGDLIGDTGKSTIQMIQGVATAGIAMSAAIATAEKGSVILAAISIALQAIQWIAGLFNNDDELEERIQNIQMEVDALSNAFDRLQHSYDQTFWVFSDEEKAAHEQRLQGIKDEIAALEQQAVVARQSWDFLRYAQLTKQIKELKNALEKEQNNGDMFEIYELQKQNLREQQELIKQQIQAEKDKKDTDNNKIAEWEEAIRDINTQLDDLERDMLETLAGTDVQTAIDDFADALVDAYCQGEDAAKALGEVTKETLKNAVVEALKRQFLAKAINDAVLYLGEAMQDGVLSDYEKKRFEEMVKKGADKFNMALEGVGDWIKDQTEEEEESDPLTGAVTSMSEETGGVIAGRLNAFVINQSDQIAIMKRNLAYQAEIAANTSYCKRLDDIAESLKRIETKDNSLLSQGVS